MSRFYVYGLFEKTNKSLDNCFYIGKGCRNRLNEHFFNDHKKGDNLYKDRKISKIKSEGGEVYSRKIVSNLEEDIAYQIEEELISEIGLDNLTNLIPGGRGGLSGENNPMYGKTRSKEVRNKMSKSHTGKSLSESHKRKISEGNKGKSHSDDTLKKMSKVKRGSKNPMYGLDGEDNPFYNQSHSDETKEKLAETNSTLKKKEAKEIKWLALNSDITQKQISNKYNISRQHVSQIKLEKRWSYIEPTKPEDY